MRLVDVDALDRAAALAGVVHGAVGERFGGRFGSASSAT
jgi:hypothetical protein